MKLTPMKITCLTQFNVCLVCLYIGKYILCLTFQEARIKVVQDIAKELTHEKYHDSSEVKSR